MLVNTLSMAYTYTITKKSYVCSHLFKKRQVCKIPKLGCVAAVVEMTSVILVMIAAAMGKW